MYPHPQQAGPKIPPSLNVHRKVAISSICTLNSVFSAASYLLSNQGAGTLFMNASNNHVELCFTVLHSNSPWSTYRKDTHVREKQYLCLV